MRRRFAMSLVKRRKKDKKKDRVEEENKELLSLLKARTETRRMLHSTRAMSSAMKSRIKESHQAPPAAAAAAADECVWVHRMVLAVHSPVFRSLLRDGGGSRESREGVIDMRGPEHPPGHIVKSMLKMMYASPGLAIDEIDKEPKLSDEWEFLLQLFKLAHLYQVEVALDACTRRLKQILERKDHTASGGKARSSSGKASSRESSNEEHGSEEEEERTKQTCYALELLSFLLHVQEAETREHASMIGHPSDLAFKRLTVSMEDVGIRQAGADAEADMKKTASLSEDEATAWQLNGTERREEMLLRMLDAYLYPQLTTIVQQIRCEDVLTLQHLLRLAVCRPSPSSPRSSLSHAFSWASTRTTQPLSKYS